MNKTYILVLVYSIISILSTLVVDCKSTETSTSDYNEIFRSLIEYTDPIKGYDWPPVLEISDDTLVKAKSKVYYDPQKDKFGLKVVITKGLISKIAEFDENIIAFIYGHEIAHIVLGHLKSIKNGPMVLNNALTLEEEFDADLEGMKIAINAGYSYESIIKKIENMISGGYNRSAIDCLGKDHPPWSDRLSFLDSSKVKIWRSLSTFTNGVTFLSIEQYDPAIYCFEFVTEQFPDCYEAYVNLGYAKLMQYMGSLDAEDIKKLQIGCIASGTYYKEPGSILTRTWKADVDTWWEAVGNFKYALRLNKNLTLAKANLGLAYLVSPLKEADIGNAAKYLSEALELVEKDTTLSEAEKAGIYNNAGVSFKLAGERDSIVVASYEKAAGYERQLGGFDNLHKDFTSLNIHNSLMFNKALLLSNSDKTDDLENSLRIFEDFLENTRPISPWWDIGYEHYLNLNKKISTVPKSRKELHPKMNNQILPILGIRINENDIIVLSDRKDVFLSRFGNDDIIEKRICAENQVKRISIKGQGIELLASRYIFAIVLKDTISPGILIDNGNGTTHRSECYVGMSLEDFENLIGPCHYKDGIFIINKVKPYRYYMDLGLAVRINHKTNIVEELVIAKL